MAIRPIFVPTIQTSYVEVKDCSFTWFAGFSLQQKQRSIASLHEAGQAIGLSNILEISSKSTEKLGRELSAFNLKLQLPNLPQLTVEALFQSSKVFEQAGPFPEFWGMSGREIKKDLRLRNSGDLCSFELQGVSWPLEPKTIFYDWLYLTALMQNPHLSEKLLKYDGFTDIAFNPKKSFNCQARSAALFVALSKNDSINLSQVLQSTEQYLALFDPNYGNPGKQLYLF